MEPCLEDVASFEQIQIANKDILAPNLWKEYKGWD